jgi:hypothetical protein
MPVLQDKHVVSKLTHVKQFVEQLAHELPV